MARTTQFVAVLWSVVLVWPLATTSAYANTILHDAGDKRLVAAEPLPSTATNGEAFNIVLRVEDTHGNPIAGADVSLSQQSGPTTDALSGDPAGTLATGADGTVTFGGLTLTGVTGDYVLHVNYGTPDTHEYSFTVALDAGTAVTAVLVGQPHPLVVRGQPLNLLAAHPFSPTVQLRDSGGNDATGSTANVTVNLRRDDGTLVGGAGTIIDLTAGEMTGSRSFGSARIDAPEGAYMLEFIVTSSDFDGINLLTDTFTVTMTNPNPAPIPPPPPAPHPSEPANPDPVVTLTVS